MTTELELHNNGASVVATLDDPRDVPVIEKKIDALRKAMAAEGRSITDQNQVAMIGLHAQAKAHELLAAMRERGELAVEGRPKTATACCSIDDLGITRTAASRWGKVWKAKGLIDEYVEWATAEQQVATRQGLWKYADDEALLNHHELASIPAQYSRKDAASILRLCEKVYGADEPHGEVVLQFADAGMTANEARADLRAMLSDRNANSDAGAITPHQWLVLASEAIGRRGNDLASWLAAAESITEIVNELKKAS